MTIVNSGFSYNVARLILLQGKEHLESSIRQQHHIVVIYGWQLGDEGKGKVTTLFRDVDFVAVATGGGNAGHTVYIDTGRKVAFHELPGGAIIEKAKVYLGQGRVIDLVGLEKEIEVLAQNGIDPQGKIIIAGGAHLVLDLDKELDKKIEGIKTSKVGTTNKWIWPTYANKSLRTGLNVNMLRSLLDEKLEEIAHVNGKLRDMDVEAILENIYFLRTLLNQMCEKYGIVIDETNMLLNKAAHEGKKILVEHSQSALLDVDGGNYPYCTSSSTGVNGVLSWLNLPQLGTNIAVMKLIKSKVGNGGFPTKIVGDAADAYRQASGEFGATTGRPRDIGFFDVVEARKVLRTNTTNSIFFTKADLLHKLDLPQRFAVAYSGRDGKIYTEELPPLGEEVTVEYSKEYPLGGSIEGITTKDELPMEYRIYFDALIDALDFKGNVLIGTGPWRDEYIVYQ